MTQQDHPSESAFQATFASFRLIPSRKVSQLIFEVPIEATDNALSVLGGVPNPEKTKWVGIAPIEVRPKLSGKDIWRASAECAMLCNNDKYFQRFMGAKNKDECAVNVRQKLEIESRSALDSNSAKARAWETMRLNYYRWLEEHGKQTGEAWSEEGRQWQEAQTYTKN